MERLVRGRSRPAVGLPERAIEGLVFRNVRIRSRRGMLIRHASADLRGLRIEAADGRPLIEERGALIARR